MTGVTTRQHGPSALARRQKLLQATIEVAARVGIAGVTHRAVTEQAGLPLATISYFFDSIDTLIEEALRERARADTREQVALAEALADAHTTPDGIARAFASDITQRFPETLALFEMLLHAARDPAIRDAVGGALAAKRQAAAAGARAAGSPEPDTAAPALVALVHGLMLHEMAVPGCLPPESMYSAFRALFLGFLLDNGHVELALQLRRQSSPTNKPNSSGAQHNSPPNRP